MGIPISLARWRTASIRTLMIPTTDSTAAEKTGPRGWFSPGAGPQPADHLFLGVEADDGDAGSTFQTPSQAAGMTTLGSRAVSTRTVGREKMRGRRIVWEVIGPILLFTSRATPIPLRQGESLFADPSLSLWA